GGADADGAASGAAALAGTSAEGAAELDGAVGAVRSAIDLNRPGDLVAARAALADSVDEWAGFLADALAATTFDRAGAAELQAALDAIEALRAATDPVSFGPAAEQAVAAVGAAAASHSAVLAAEAAEAEARAAAEAAAKAAEQNRASSGGSSGNGSPALDIDCGPHNNCETYPCPGLPGASCVRPIVPLSVTSTGPVVSTCPDGQWMRPFDSVQRHRGSEPIVLSYPFPISYWVDGFNVSVLKCDPMNP
ncbi:hypothetical protein, partial [Agromyces seonyuensis]|nr:hypothetical protein [Agromyces seonyuensis]